MSKTLRELIEDSVNLSRDSVRENEIVGSLRQLANPEVLAVLKEMIQRKSACAIPVARRVVNDAQVAKELFLFALTTTDAQRIKDLLEFAITKMGARAAICVLAERKDEDPATIENACYWLYGLIRPEDKELLRLLD